MLLQRRWHTKPLDAVQNRREQRTRHCHLGHLESGVPAVSTPPAGCTPEEFDLADLLGDDDVDLGDFGEFCQAFSP